MIYILLPAYNEALSLPGLLPKLAKTAQDYGEDYQIVICDDGSTDNTLSVLDNYKHIPIHIIKHKINRGLGETSRDLFEYAASVSSRDDVIIRLDCDDTHEPKFMHDMIQSVRSGHDVVVASRFQKGGGQLGLSRYRRIISRAANIFMKCLFPIRGLKEYSCGYRAYRSGLIRQAIRLYGNNFIQLKGLGFTCTLEKLVKLKLLGASFAEVPFLLRYDQKKSDSKMVSGITTYGYLTLAVVYYWPWGGWRSAYKKKLGQFDAAVEESY